MLNENLKGVNKDRQIYEIKPMVAIEKLSFDEFHEKGYVNWPLATTNSKYWCTVTHLPTGLSLGDIPHAETWKENKTVVDKLVSEIGVSELENITSGYNNPEIVSKIKEILRTQDFTVENKIESLGE